MNRGSTASTSAIAAIVVKSETSPNQYGPMMMPAISWPNADGRRRAQAIKLRATAEPPDDAKFDQKEIHEGKDG